MCRYSRDGACQIVFRTGPGCRKNILSCLAKLFTSAKNLARVRCQLLDSTIQENGRTTQQSPKGIFRLSRLRKNQLKEMVGTVVF